MYDTIKYISYTIATVSAKCISKYYTFPATTHRHDTKIFNKRSTHDEHQCHACSSFCKTPRQYSETPFTVKFQYDPHNIADCHFRERASGLPRMCICTYMET